MEFNPCRTSAFKAFCATLSDLRGQPNISERQFRDAWLDHLRKDETLYAAGWYDPPRYGLSVLFSSEQNPERISFESLRKEKFWPGDAIADWQGFLFAYSSCVSRETGMIGDFDITLYFGTDPKLKTHYKNCFSATDAVLRSIKPGDTSQKIFKRSEEFFATAGLKNTVISVTDVTALDLGHTCPSLENHFPLN